MASRSPTSDCKSSASSWTSLDNDNTEDHNTHHASSTEPIAIIGMSCRLPGSAHDINSFWEMLASGRSAWSPDPGSRFNAQAFQDKSQNKADTTNSNGGHFLKEDVAGFDVSFFEINAVEAKAIDPQQRLLLEVAYESFQNAGLSTESISGSNTGVFTGQWSYDYHEIQTRDTLTPPLYIVTGTGPATLSNRISYQFNLHGPSLTMDTGCSSSIVALHQAVNSLRSGETSMCFVGSANLLLDPHRFVYMSKMKMLSPDGRSFSFDSRANGYGRGEGIAGLVLKPLSAALRDGNPIRAVIRNSVLNQDGRTPGIMVPSEDAQERAILKAYSDLNLEPFADYVEAHGTGTKVGDPKEASAIAAAFTKNRTLDRPLAIGSVKGNIGHTEATSGLAGVIKAVLMLEKQMIPPQASFKTANPDLQLESRQLRISTKLEKTRLERISLNNFGYGGTNGHVVIDAAPPIRNNFEVPRAVGQSTCDQSHIFFISAANEKSCQRICSRLAQYIVRELRQFSDPNALLLRLAYTLSMETVHAHRLSIVASNVDELLSQLGEASNAAVTRQDARQDPRIALVFSGQGAQYAKMGMELLETQPVFTRSMERASRHLKQLGSPWDLIEELKRAKDQSRINEPTLSQPSCTALQISLVDMLAALGISPTAVVGHSSGEIAAAYASGVISFEDALAIAYFRGKLVTTAVTESETPGAMLAVGAEPNIVDERINTIPSALGQLRIACFNSPSSVTVSGDASAIDELKAMLDRDGIFNRKLATDGAAYHSHQMKLVEKDYQTALSNELQGSGARRAEDSARVFSSVTGKELTDNAMATSSYWVKNLVSPVLFSHALEVMSKQKFNGEQLDLILEVGPHAQLRGPVQQTLKKHIKADRLISYINTLTRGENSNASMLKALGILKVKGSSFSLHRIHGFSKRNHPDLLVNLPPYPFDHEHSYWHETRISRDYRSREYLPHELLGSRPLYSHHVEPTWRHFLSVKESPWLLKHLIQGQVVFPAAGFIVMAEQAAKQYALSINRGSNIDSVRFRNISLNQALVLPKGSTGIEIVLSLHPASRTVNESSKIWNEFRISTVSPENSWTEHCRGLVYAVTDLEADDGTLNFGDKLVSISDKCTHKHNPEKFYHLSRDLGVDWQSPFNNTTSLRTSKDACITTALGIMDDVCQGGLDDPIHPSLLDSCLFHGLYAVKTLEGATSACVPYFIAELAILNKPIQSNELVTTSIASKERNGFDVFVQDGSGSQLRAVIEAHGVRTKDLPGDTALSEHIKDISHSQSWVPYVDSWTPEHRNQICKVDVPPGSTLDLNHCLRSLSLYFIRKAMKEVSLESVPSGHRRHFLAWMQEHASDAAEETTMPQIPAELSNNSLIQGVLRIGPDLARILTNDADPLALLTSDDLLSKLYNTEGASRCISQMAEYCHALGQQCHKLKVLEVGAGTGSATVPMLKALNGRGSQFASRYDFTDLSTGFFSHARDILGNLVDAVEFNVLDVEKLPAEQGFEESSYDLIVASNVIHATTCLDRVLHNMRTLLKPGGRFMLMEIVELKELYYGLIFGVFEGWWAGYEEGRCLSPLLTRPEWLSKLNNAGFSNPQLCFEDYSEEDGGSLAVFISRKQEMDSPLGLLPIHVVSEMEYKDVFHNIQDEQVRKQLHELDVSVKDISADSPGENVAILMPDIAKSLCQEPNEQFWQKFQNWILMAKIVLLVSCNANETLDDVGPGIWLGFARCVRKERPDIRIITLHLDVSSVMLPARLAQVLPSMLERVQKENAATEEPSQEDEFMEKDGQIFVSRIVQELSVTDYIHNSRKRGAVGMIPFKNTNDTLIGELGVPGLIESLRWRHEPGSSSLAPDDVRIELRAASVNFKDVLIAAGQLDGLTEMRNDCSGTVVEVGANMRERFQPGDRVCALYSRSYTNYPVVHGDCCNIIPDTLSWEEGAALPVVWTTVYYSLVDMGQLAKGQSILIHSAAGAVGQAAILLAQHIGATIYVTAGSQGKFDMLHEKYNIPRENMFSSRTPAFYNGVRSLTEGRGVDLVLNSLSGEMFRHSCNLVAPFGRFVEIGRKDLMDDASMPMGFLLKNITFSYVDMALIMDEQKPLARRILRDVVDLVASGAIKSVSLSILPISDIETAFRQIQAGKHMGKIVLAVEKDQMVQGVSKLPDQAKFVHNATYAIAGGLGGLGRAIIQWMAERGAKHILCLSRSGNQDEQIGVFLNEMRERGVRILIQKCDISREDDVAVLAQATARAGLPEIQGVIQCATVAKDAPFEAMKASDWCGSLAPKVRGTLNLHLAFGKELDFFVVMSSAVALHGSGGLSNYAAACSFQDALVRRRVASGMPSFSINAGAIREVGFVSENPVAAAALQRHGLGTISILDLLAMLNYAITRPDNQDPANCVLAVGLLPNRPRDSTLSARRFLCLQRHDVASSHTQSAENSPDDAALLHGALSQDEANALILRAITKQLSKLTDIAVESINAAQPLQSYGVDSLVAVELRNWISIYLQADISLIALRSAGSITELANLSAKECRLIDKNS